MSSWNTSPESNRYSSAASPRLTPCMFLGEIDIGERKSATAGAELLGRAMNMSGEEFSRLVVKSTEELIENLIVDYVIQRYWQNSLTNFISARKDNPVLGVDFSIKLPLIGIGAAARYFLPGVAKNLRTTVSFPEHGEVGNAIGAAIIGMAEYCLIIRSPGLSAVKKSVNIMKILSVSDTVVKELLEPVGGGPAIAGIELILACGDLPPEYLSALRHRYDTPLLYVLGNHDLRYGESPPVGCIAYPPRIVKIGQSQDNRFFRFTMV